MKKYLLDTNVIIDFLKGDKNTIEIFKSIKNYPLFISVITIAEYHYGALRSFKVQETIDLFLEFSKAADFIELPIDKEVAKKFAEIQAELSKKGKLRPAFDLLIASTCIVNDCILTTKNRKDFVGIAELKILK